MTIIDYTLRPLSTADKLTLGFLFLLHWSMILMLATYGWWGRARFDTIFLVLFLIMVVAWMWLGNCPISLVERKLLYVHADRMPGYVNPSIQFYQPSGFWSFMLMSFICIVYLGTLYFVLQRKGVPRYISLAMCIVVVVILGEARMQEFKQLSQ